jgi:hypothetical protein
MPESSKKAETMLKAELEDFLASLREIALSCGGRNADSREIQLVRRELAARDQRISSLEQTLQRRDEIKVLMEQEQQSLLKQLADARVLVKRVEAARTAQLAAQDHARKVLAGSPSAQELLEHELEELQAAEDRAREAREARRGAAVRRKVAIEAELEADKAKKTPVAKKSSPPSNPSAPVAMLPPAPSPPAAQRVASPAPPPVQSPQARSPAAPPKAPVPPPAAVKSPAAPPVAPPPVRVREIEGEEEGEEEEGSMETGDVETSAAVAAVEAALLAVAPRPVAPAEDDDDFDTMGWPATQPKTPLGAAGTEMDDDDAERNLPDLAHLRAEAGAAARPAQAPTAAKTPAAKTPAAKSPAAKTPSPAKTAPPTSPAKTSPPASPAKTAPLVSPPTAQLPASPPILASAGSPPPLVVTAKSKASEELDGLEDEEIWSYGDSDESESEFESEEDPPQDIIGKASAPAVNVIVLEAQKHAEQQRQAQMRAEEQARVAAAALKVAAQQAETAKDAAEHAREKLAQAKQAVAAKATSKKSQSILSRFVGRKKGAQAHDEEGGSNVSALEAEVQRLDQIATSASEAKEGAQVREMEARRHAEAAAKDTAEAETRAAAHVPAPLPPFMEAPPPAAAKKPPAAAPIELQPPQPLVPPTASLAAPAPPSSAKQAAPMTEAVPVSKVAPVPTAPPGLGATPVDEDQDDDSEDSDYDLDPGEEPTGKPVLRDQLLMAKLYGYEGFGTAPPENSIDWSLRSVALHADANIWHADIEPPQGEYDGMRGRIDLRDVSACDFTIGRMDELCLSQQGKCHLLRIDQPSTTTIPQWRESILQLLRGLKEGTIDDTVAGTRHE